MNFSQALDSLLALPDWERGTGSRPAREAVLLERPAALLNALGNPQTRFRSVLVAGTKGKGSTAAMLESILRARGLKTGLYTSPHLHFYRERIRVNGEMISENDFARGVGEMQPLFVELCAQHSAFESYTTFEAVTALALQHFAQEKIDIAILEVGLGGRLDATNVVDADLSLVTPISYDHQHVLGNELHKIAFEKAGIIKEGKIVLTAPQEPEAMNVIEQAAREKNAVLGIGERDWIWLGGHDDFLVAGIPREGLWQEYWVCRDLHVPLLGTHQFVNAALAVAAARVIFPLFPPFPFTEGNKGNDAVADGLAKTEWSGRLEILQARGETHALVIADGAHNGDSAEKLFAALKFHFEFERLFLIFGVLGDKNLQEIATPFVGSAEFVWTLQPNHPRARDAAQVAAQWNAFGVSAHAVAAFPTAFSQARQRATPRDMILITGSLSIVAHAREFFGLAHIS